MNAMQMLKQQDFIHGRSSLGQPLNHHKPDTSTDSEGFQSMLQEVRANSDRQQNHITEVIPDQSLTPDKDVDGSWLSFLKQTQPHQTTIIPDEVQETLELRQDMIDQLLSGSEMESLRELSISHDLLMPLNKKALNIIEELLSRMEQKGNLFSASEMNQDVKKAAVQLLEILKVIEQTGHRMSQNMTGKENLITLQNGTEPTNAETIWRKLMSTFNKRADLAAKQLYNTEAKIMSQDVGKWLQNALKEANTPVIEDPIITKMTGQTMPMSRIEQFVIYTAQQQPDALEPDKQLIEQFQKAVQSSRFMTQKEGNLRLNFALRPENLGDMTVRLAQINGQMTVKILVSTHAAKDIMEKNIHQLKHMFSPHQVVIERQEIQVNQNEGLYADQEDQGKEDTSGGHHSDQSDENNDHAENKDTFQDQLSDILDEKA